MTGQGRSEKEEVTEKSRSSSAIGFGTSFAVGMAIFALAGHALDVKTGHESLFTLIGIGLGFVYGGWELWKLASPSSKASGGEEPEKHETGDHDARTP